MKGHEIAERLVAAGWVEESVATMPKNRLNAGMEAHLSYNLPGLHSDGRAVQIEPVCT